MHHSGSCLFKVPVQLFTNLYVFLLYFLTCRLDWYACINLAVVLALLWLYVLMKTLLPERHPAPCQIYGIYRFSSWNIKQEPGFNWPTNVFAKGGFPQMSLIHSTSIYWAPLRVQALCLSVNTIVNETDAQGPGLGGGCLQWETQGDTSKYVIPYCVKWREENVGDSNGEQCSGQGCY